MARGRMIDKVIILSKKINKISEGAENLYYRLLVMTDDFGRYHADPEIIKGTIYTRRKVSLSIIKKRVNELWEIGLIKLYEDDSEQYLEIVKFENHQKFRDDVKKKADYPEPKKFLQRSRNKPVTTRNESERNETKRCSKLSKDKLSKDKEVCSENNSPNSPKPKTYKFEIKHTIEAKYLESAIKATSPKHTIQGNNYLESWANTFRIMEEKKEATMDEVRFIIDFAMRDKFWYRNILSADKLRKQFGRLWEDAKQDWEEKKHLYVGRNKNES